MENFQVSDRELFKNIIYLSGPAILEQFFQTAVQYADTAMVGRLGADASASTGLTSSIMWLIGSLIAGVGVALVAQISRAVGAGEKEKAHRYAGEAFWLTLAIGAFLGTIMLCIYKKVPVWMGADPEIRETAGIYLGLICFPMIFKASGILFAAVLRGVGDMKNPMRINIFMNLLNVVLNFWMIYPTRMITLFGFSFSCPGLDLGVAGAGIATAISLVAGGVLMALAVFRNKDVSPIGFLSLPTKAELGPLFVIALPILLQRFTACMGHIVFARLVASLGTICIAAHSIAITAEQLFYIAGYGVQAAASTLSGNCLGARDEKAFPRLVRLLCAVTVGMMFVTGTLLFLFPAKIMSFFTADAAVIAAGAEVLRLVALSEPMYGVQIIFEGIFNGIGDTKPPFIYAIISMWGVRILISFLCINVFHLGLFAVWCCMVADNVFRALLMLQRYLRGKWKIRFRQPV